MRTTIRIDDQLLEEAKQLAIRRGTSLTALIEDALGETLSRQHGSEQREPARLVTFDGKGLLPGVDLDDSATLLDLMEASPMILVDVNVLVYSHRMDAPRHAAYRKWLEELINGDQAYALSELVLSRFLRVVTHPRVFNPPSNLTSAIAFA